MEKETIKLGGKQWDIPMLPIAVMKHVYPRASALQRLRAEGERITTEDFDMVIEIITIAIAYAQPGFTKVELEKVVAPFPEWMKAVGVVMRQCGAQEGEAPAGEAKAGETLSTGMN